MRRSGYALATVVILLGVAMFGAAAIVTISRLESKISRSQQEGVSAYYVAEAGVQDALWRLNTNTAYSDALQNGTLNISYSANNVPTTGQGFSVSLTADAAAGGGHGIIDVTGTSNNGDFIAKRHIRINVFQGADSAIGQNAFFASGSVTITNGSSVLNFTNGGLYTSGNVSINSARVNTGSNDINAVGTYSANPGSTVTTNAIHASNYPPAAAAIGAPTFDFVYYSTHFNNKYTAAQFQALFSTPTVTLPGPVTYISGAVSLGNWAKNKTLNVTGMLIINGNFTVNGSVSGFVMNVSDPGNGKSGLFSSGATSISQGNWTINGLLYSAGSLSVSLGASQNMTINGAFVAGGTVSLNTGLTTNLTYNDSRATATLGAGTAAALQVEHWEEEY